MSIKPATAAVLFGIGTGVTAAIAQLIFAKRAEREEGREVTAGSLFWSIALVGMVTVGSVYLIELAEARAQPMRMQLSNGVEKTDTHYASKF